MKINNYTIDQLATIFGVSITTVDKWIETGRIKDVDKQAESISNRAIWLSATGEQVPIREVVERLKEIVKTINCFEDRYGGLYEQIVLKKGDPDTTGDWQWGHDGKEWRNHLIAICKSPEMTITKLKEKLLVEELSRFEDDFPDSVFAVPSSPDSPKVKVRALSEYCKQHDKKISELSEEELEQFLDRKHE